VCRKAAACRPTRLVAIGSAGHGGPRPAISPPKHSNPEHFVEHGSGRVNIRRRDRVPKAHGAIPKEEGEREGKCREPKHKKKKGPGNQEKKSG